MPICGRSAYTDASGPVTKLKSGSKVTFAVDVTAHHKGHFQFRLCDKTINSGVDGNACFDKFPLQRVRPSEIHSDCAVNDKRGDCQPYYDDLADLWFCQSPRGSIMQTRTSMMVTRHQRRDPTVGQICCRKEQIPLQSPGVTVKGVTI